MPSDDGKLPLYHAVEFIKVRVSCPETLRHSLLVNLVQFFVEMRGIVETRNRPWLTERRDVVQLFRAVFHQDIVCVLAVLWIFNLPTAISANATSDLFGHCLARTICVCCDNYFPSLVKFVLSVPQKSKLVVVLWIDVVVHNLHHCAVRH